MESTLRSAKNLLVDEITVLEKVYLVLRTSFEASNLHLLQNARRYMDAALVLATGGFYWSTFCA